MDTVEINYIQLENCVCSPCYATAGAAGLDLFAATLVTVTIKPGARALIPVGIILEIPPGYEGQIRARSGLSLDFGISVLNGVGTVDSDFRGELKVILVNLGEADVDIQPGQRIAQLVVSKVSRATLHRVKSMGPSERGESGFGSTGR